MTPGGTLGWTAFSASIVDRAAWSCGCKVSASSLEATPPTRWWTSAARALFGPAQELKLSQTCMLDYNRACKRFCSSFLGMEFLGVARGRRESSLRNTGFHLYFLEMMLSCWPHQAGAVEVRGRGSRPETGRSCFKWRSSSISRSSS